MTQAPVPTPGARETVETVYRAANIAIQHQHEFVTLEHLLAALIEKEDIQVHLRNLKVDYESIAERLEDFFKADFISKARRGLNPTPSTTLDAVVTHAVASAQLNGRPQQPMDLLAQMLKVSHEDNFAVTMLLQHGLDPLTLKKYLSHGAGAPAGGRKQIGPDGQEIQPSTQAPTTKEEAEEYLKQFTANLNELAGEKKIDPLIGRLSEVDALVQITARRTKNNACIVGEPGVGKTAIVEGLALLITRNEVPEILKGVTIYSLDIGALVAGTRFRGDFEERMKNVVKSLEMIGDDAATPARPILFIDEIHMVMGAGSGSSGSLDVANLLKPALAKGTLRCIGSTTDDEFRKIFEKDKAMLRRFKKVPVYEPSVEDAKLILRGLRPLYEAYHGVEYSDEALDAAVDLTHRYVNSKFLPDKAIDVIDSAGARQKITDGERKIVKLGVVEIEAEVSKEARIPAKTIHEGEGEKLARLETELDTKVFGQKRATAELVDAAFLSRAGLREANKPSGAYLFAGPTGVGKTEVAKVLAEVLGIPLLRYDMSEYMEEHAVSKLIGAPPGYVGHDEGGKLINDVDANPYCIVLLDEIEKAHPKVINVLLQVFDNATLESSTGKKANFRNVIVIMTSNVGVSDASRNGIGFKSQPTELDLTPAINKHFPPEFRNRLDAILQFNSLDPAVMGSIVDKFIGSLSAMTEDRNVVLTVTPEARERLAKDGYDKAMGARPLTRVITDKIKKPLSRLLLIGDLVNGGTASVEIVENEIKVVAKAA